MPALWPRRAARVLSIVLVMNALFALLHYVGTGVPAEFAEQRVARAFKHQNLVPEHYPSLRYGLTSNYTLVGIDLYTDCFISLMLLTVGGPSWQDALNPRVAASQPRHGNYCQRLQHLVRGDAGLDLDRSKPKPRLWHGAKAVLAMGLVPFNYFQLNNLLKLCSYFAYAVLALLTYHRHREAFVLALPLLLLGFFSSGVVYHGGISNALPHLMALLVAVGLLLAAPWLRAADTITEAALVAGSLMAFVYVLDGSMMLALPVSGFLWYFVLLHDRPDVERLRCLSRWLGWFVGGFMASLLVKQGLSAWSLGVEEVFGEFWRAARGRSLGGTISAADALAAQFAWFRTATLNHAGIAHWLMTGSVVAGVIAVAIGLLLFYGRRDTRALLGLLVLGGLGSLILLRYGLLANHSKIHVIIVSRYLFVLFACAWMALIWSLMRLRLVWHRGDREGTDTGALPYRPLRNTFHAMLLLGGVVYGFYRFV